MPAVRLSRRRRSSLAISFTPAKAGIYGISRPVTFAPNVTPVTFVEPEDFSSASTSEPGSPTSALFPPSEIPVPPPTRRRGPPGKRRSMGYIPRPPNAFMLFRADFVRQKHVPGTIETNHGSLSKIIGNCWRALPLEEKRVWEVKAKHAKAEHKARYPEYRFRPVHNKNKDKKKDKPTVTVEDERRCEEVAQLLLSGKKGDELAAAVRNLDLVRSKSPIQASALHRRPSSVPLPNDYYPYFGNIAIPSAPFFSVSRPQSPVNSIARQQQRMMLGNRRASSAGPAIVNRSWTMPLTSFLQRDPSPLPDVDTSLFNPNYLEGANNGFSFNSFNEQFSNAMNAATPQQHSQHHDQNSFGPLDNISPHDILANQNLYSQISATPSLSELDPMSWMGQSHPSTAYSGSPSPSEAPVLHAPQPQNIATPNAFADVWKEFDGSFTSGDFEHHQQFTIDAGLGTTFDPTHEHEVDLDLSCMHQQQDGSATLDTLLQSQLFSDSFSQDFNSMSMLHA